MHGKDSSKPTNKGLPFERFLDLKEFENKLDTGQL